jgi:hypothetical protein
MNAEAKRMRKLTELLLAGLRERIDRLALNGHSTEQSCIHRRPERAGDRYRLGLHQRLGRAITCDYSTRFRRPARARVAVV